MEVKRLLALPPARGLKRRCQIESGIGDSLFVFGKPKKLELYDLDADIGEKNDLADQHPELVQRLHDKFKAWRSQMAPKIRRPGRNCLGDLLL